MQRYPQIVVQYETERSHHEEAQQQDAPVVVSDPAASHEGYTCSGSGCHARGYACSGAYGCPCCMDMLALDLSWLDDIPNLDALPIMH